MHYILGYYQPSRYLVGISSHVEVFDKKIYDKDISGVWMSTASVALFIRLRVNMTIDTYSVPGLAQNLKSLNLTHYSHYNYIRKSLS